MANILGVLVLVISGYLFVFTPVHGIMTCSNGRECATLCENCANVTLCQSQNGICSSSCKLWWTGKTCNVEIIVPDHKNETSEIKQITETSIVITWEPLQHLPPEGAAYYAYVITYRMSNSFSDFKGPIVKHQHNTALLEARIENLEDDMMYHLRVRPFREMFRSVDYGEPYERLEATILDDDDDFGEMEERTESLESISWILFGIACGIILVLVFVIIFLYVKYVKNNYKKRQLTHFDGVEADLKNTTNSHPYSSTIIKNMGMEDSSLKKDEVGAITSDDMGGYEIPCVYSVCNPPVTVTPYEIMRQRSHIYQNNFNPYEQLKQQTKDVADTSQGQG